MLGNSAETKSERRRQEKGLYQNGFLGKIHEGLLNYLELYSWINIFKNLQYKTETLQ